MVDPMSLSVAMLLGSAAEGAAQEAGRGTADALGRLAATVRRRLAGDPHAQRALAAVERAPAERVPPDEASTQALAAAIERASEDEQFRAELRELLAEAERDPHVGRFVTEVRDHAQVGKIVNVGAARDLHL
jgi:hypothetical protein